MSGKKKCGKQKKKCERRKEKRETEDYGEWPEAHYQHFPLPI